MTEIEEYNACAKKLMEDLSAGESDFSWSYMAWGKDQEKMCFPPVRTDNLKYWYEYYDSLDREPPTLDELRKQELSYIRIRAMTNKRYAKGRLFIDQQISRVLIEDDCIDVVSNLIFSANLELIQMLTESNERQ